MVVSDHQSILSSNLAMPVKSQYNNNANAQVKKQMFAYRSKSKQENCKDLENEAYDNMVNAINKFKPGKVKGGLIQFDEGEGNTVPRRKRSQSFVAEQINRSQESSKSDDNNESMSASGAKFGIDNLPKRPYKEIKMLKTR